MKNMLVQDPYLIDQLRFMQDQESTHYKVDDDYFPSWATASPEARKTMASWSYVIADACQVERETACIATSYFDRFMSTSSHRARGALVSRREFQLVYIVCLVIALKCRAGMQVEPDFVADVICQKVYDQEELNKMEEHILKALQWRLNGPSPHDFIDGFIQLLPSHASSNSKMVSHLTDTAKIKAEAAVLDYSMALQPPSSIAYAAIFTSMRSIDSGEFNTPDKVAWMQNIAGVTGIRTAETDLTSHVICEEDEMERQGPLSPNSFSGIIDLAAPSARSSYMEQEHNNYCSASSTTSSMETFSMASMGSTDFDEASLLDSSIRSQPGCDMENNDTSWTCIADMP